MDRISNLPDEIICHIGSFLSAKDAAFAMVLSRRWRNLFTIEPELVSDFMDEDSFEDFTDQVYALPLDSRIRKFSISWDFGYIEHDHIDRCLSRALKHGVVDLELDVNVDEDEDDRYSPPLEVFSCETVGKLSLGRLRIDLIPGKAYLPALKSLSLDSVQLYQFDTLLSACPVLEELEINSLKEWECSRTVSSPTIKRLTIYNNFVDDEEFYDESENESVSFDTPALTYLEYEDLARKEYPIVNLNSLVEAVIDIRKEAGIPSDPTNLFKGLKNVEVLSVSDETLELIHDLRKAVPMFENLSHLTLVNKEDRCCWFGLPLLVQKSPKLKTLTIKGHLHHSKPLCECLLGYSFLLTRRIEVLKITEFKGGVNEMLLVKKMLEKLPYLKLLEICITVFDGDKEMKIKESLLKIPKGSSKCKIKVVTRFAQVCDEKEEEEEEEEEEETEEGEEENEEEAVSGRCESIIATKGLRCKRSAAKGSKWCWQHKEKKISRENSE